MSDEPRQPLYSSEDQTDRILSPEESLEDEVYGASLRPRSFEDYVGQHRVVDNLRIAIEAARGRDEPLEQFHFVLHVRRCDRSRCGPDDPHALS